MEKKVVLQINTVCGVGSTGRIAQDLSNVMEENGIDCFVAYGYGKSSLKNSIKIGTTLEYYIHNILSRITGRQGRYSYYATKRFLKKVDKIKPDIIHLHNIHGNYINYVVLFNYIKKNKIPVIWTLHDCWAYTGKCVHYDYINCNKWQNQCYQCKQISSYPQSCFFDFSKKQYQKKKNMFTAIENMYIVTPSQWLAKEVEKSYLKKYPIEVIHNGIDLTKFQKTESSFKTNHNIEEKFMILGVASEWGKRKGLDTFIQLAKTLDKQYQIVLIGLAKEEKKNVPNNIIKIEKTNSVEELADIYSAADVLVNPTVEDNFPTVNLEALACGIPVITYNTGGSGEAINSKCGIIVEKNNMEKLMEAINYLKNNKILSADCIQQSKEFDKEKCFQKYITLYERILKKEQ